MSVVDTASPAETVVWGNFFSGFAVESKSWSEAIGTKDTVAPGIGAILHRSKSQAPRAYHSQLRWGFTVLPPTLGARLSSPRQSLSQLFAGGAYHTAIGLVEGVRLLFEEAPANGAVLIAAAASIGEVGACTTATIGNAATTADCITVC